ncbi:antitoxin VapB family protein [Candidatus Woesearchaeota archaeon]|nr:antitoxin VapB family protein [Candidatus Woesearchaeota archaeon]
MVVKTITITELAYDSLATAKSEDESFSTAILRLTKKRSLLDSFGLMKGKEGEDFERAIREGRREHAKLKLTRDKRLWG